MPTPLYPSVQIRRLPIVREYNDFGQPVYDPTMEKIEITSLLRKEFSGLWYKIIIKSSAAQAIDSTTEYVLLRFMEEAYKAMHLATPEMLHMRDENGMLTALPVLDQRSEEERLTELYGNNQ